MALFASLYIVIAIAGYWVTDNNKVTVRVNKMKIDYNEAYLFISMVVLFLICGLRDTRVGSDTPTYVKSFQSAGELNRTISGQNKYEIGYRIFVIILRLFTDNVHVYVFVVSAVIFIGIYIFIRNNCKANYAIALLVFLAFLYYTSFSAIRQSIAVAIGINSFPYIRDRQWGKAILLILLGASFHNIGLVLLVMIPFTLTKWTRRKIIWAIILSIAGTVAFNWIVNIVLTYFPIYQRYWESSLMDAADSSIGLFAIYVIIIVIYTIIYMNTSEGKVLDPRENEQILVTLLGCIFAIVVNLLGRQYGVFSRVQRFFIPYVMILNVDIYEHFCVSKKIYYIMIAAFMGIYMITIMRTNIYHIIPYRFFF